MNIGTCIGGTWYAAADGVADAIDECALILCQLNGSQCISGLTRLRDSDYNVSLAHNGVAVAELRGILHLARYATEGLDELFTDESCVPRGTTGDNDNALGIE